MKINKLIPYLLFTAAFLLLCGLPQRADAANYTYTATTGSASSPTNWSTVTNWSLSSAPAAGGDSDDVLSFTSPNGVHMVTTNNLTGAFQLNQLNLTNNSSSTNGKQLSIAGNALEFVTNSSSVLPTLVLTRASTTSDSGARIIISAPITVTNALTITNSVKSGAVTISGAITNTGGITFGGAGISGIMGTGAISGAGGITISGSYTVNMSGNNSYTGLTDVQSGILTLNRSGGTLANTAAVQVSGGTLNVAQSDTVGAVTLSSGAISGAGTLTGSSYSLTNTGTVSAALAGSGVALTKTGAGTVTLSGANTYTGATTVSAGTLLVDGSLGNTAVTVASGATLGGSGSFGGTVDIQGTHNPGNSPGIQNFTDLAYSGGSSVVNWELKSSTTANAANPNAVFDTMVVSGDLDFAAATTLNLSFVPGDSDVLWSDTFWDTSKIGTNGWLLYDVTGTTTGFANLDLASIDWLDSGGNAFNTVLAGSGFSLYFDSANNDIYLNYTAVPEPSSYAMFGAGLLGLAALRRFRRQA